MLNETATANHEAVEGKEARNGKSRVKPRHLSPLLRQVIVEQFAARGSSEDLAEELRIPVRTVTDVVMAHLLRRGPGTAGASAQGMGIRRIA